MRSTHGMNPNFRAFQIETVHAATAQNMADDILLQEAAAQKNTIYIRSYCWNENHPLTIGRYQRTSEIPELFQEKNWVRRPTGGGLVEHRKDALTWSICLPRNAAMSDRVPDLFKKAQTSISESLRELVQIQTKRSTSEATRPSSCFLDPVKDDLLDSQARKVSGIAMYRSRQAILLQGSLQLDIGSIPPPSTSLLLGKLCEDLTHRPVEKLIPLSTLISEIHRNQARMNILSDQWQQSRE